MKDQQRGQIVIDYDITRLPLGSTEWGCFLAAVENAVAEDEAEWVEWKSTLDLANKSHIAHIAKAIVAFANRDPATAAQWVEGRGLLLVGIAPGDVQGVRPRDPADLDRAIRSLLGPDGPRFGLHWLPYREKTVLVVEVAAPTPGDPIHHIARSSGPVAEGTIFVRRPGRSEPASSADIRSLSARFVATSNVGIDIELVVDAGSGVPCCEWPPEWAEEWLRFERAYLMQPLEAARRPKLPWERSIGEYETFLTEPEDRTPEQYEAEVDDYIAECRTALAGAEIDAARYALSPVVFRVVNHTDRNYADVEVKVHIEGDVEAYEALDYEPLLDDRTPERPRRWGPRRRFPSPQTMFIPHLGRGFNPVVPVARPDITNGGSTAFTLVPVDLRAHATQVVENGLVLVTRAAVAEQLRGTWTATATNVPGRAEDTIEIPLSSDAVDLSALLTHPALTMP